MEFCLAEDSFSGCEQNSRYKGIILWEIKLFNLGNITLKLYGDILTFKFCHDSDDYTIDLNC